MSACWLPPNPADNCDTGYYLRSDGVKDPASTNLTCAPCPKGAYSSGTGNALFMPNMYRCDDCPTGARAHGRRACQLLGAFGAAAWHQG